MAICKDKTCSFKARVAFTSKPSVYSLRVLVYHTCPAEISVVDVAQCRTITCSFGHLRELIRLFGCHKIIPSEDQLFADVELEPRCGGPLHEPREQIQVSN
jgi:hypothetical protein